MYEWKNVSLTEILESSLFKGVAMGNAALKVEKDDIERLHKQPLASVRALVANKVACYMESPDLTPAGLEIAHDIIRIMAADVEVMVRRSVAQSLRRSKHLPRDVALKLAYDVEAVALPILTDAIVLTDDDLIDILQKESEVKQKAIAVRADVSERVASVIVTAANENVVSALMNNATAQISDACLEQAINRFSEGNLFKESIVKRHRLPIAIADRLAALVSDRLQDYLVEHHKLSPNISQDIMARSRERSVIQLSFGRRPEEIEEMVKQLAESERLAPSLALRALCTGNLAFFEAAMAALAGISIINARKLIYDPGIAGLKSLCETVKIAPLCLPLVQSALGIVQEIQMVDYGNKSIEKFRARVVARLLTSIDDMNEKDMEYLLDFVR